MKKGLLCDLDGTLVDTEEFILQSYAHTFKVHNLPSMDRIGLRKLTGTPLRALYTKLTSAQRCESLCETHRDFQRRNMQLVKPFRGNLDVIKRLKKAKVRIAVVTNRSKTNSAQVLEVAGMTELIDLLVSVDDVKNPKPHPEPLIYAMKYCGLQAADCFMIGDTDVDMTAGRAAGVRTIGVKYGHQGDTLHRSNPDFLIDTLKEVIPIVLS